MTRLRIGSLRSQLVILILGALAIAQAVSLWLFTDERSLAVRAALGFEAAGRAANVVRLLEDAPPDLSASIVRAANSPLVRFDLAPAPSVTTPDHHHAAYIETRIRALLGDGFSRDIRVNLRETASPLHPIPNLSPQMAEMHQEMMRGRMQAVELTLSIALSGGQWLNVDTRFERPPLQWPLSSFLAFGLTAALILVAAFWFVMTRLTGPLRDLSRAAEDLGRGDARDPLPVAGPDEVRDLTRAFNRMQDRLTRFVADRTRILAAVSHDLRSPLTAMRFDAELVEDEKTRESLIASIDEMQAMAEATLDFAQGLAGRETSEVVDLPDWLETQADDKATPFELSGGPPMTLRIRPLALRRAVRNLVENATRYGGGATVGWHRAGDDLAIEITDCGPGIPQDELEEVFAPFHRLEASRSLETGGHGLGLAIARAIVRGHGGDIRLENRPEGGLKASILIPLAEGAAINDARQRKE
ncbi:HAMP domain-containing protein [Rhodobacterales bacterium HKCCA1288]|jgi:signal transduction histidine kinase|nr:HAMP domain-containing protein [Rhodobacterales bacterium HKCCA1058]MBF9057516.1 HAMP domain-containing protein [Rhodobacterales bacterium HKCCA1065]QPI86574.1 HAMP domain-containing protein [Rhodobacterales bacterium HKCCA1288]